MNPNARKCLEALSAAQLAPVVIFFVRGSTKMSVCKRIRPAQTTYCQDKDKVVLSDKDLLDRRFLNEYPPNKGVVCLRRVGKTSIFCFGGTDSEEEFKAKGIQMTEPDGLVTQRYNINFLIQNQVVKSEMKDMDGAKFVENMEVALRKLVKKEWVEK